MSRRKTVNVNDAVRVTLTPKGMRWIRKAYPWFFDQDRLFPDEWPVFERQLWQLMLIFGQTFDKGSSHYFVDGKIEVVNPARPGVRKLG